MPLRFWVLSDKKYDIILLRDISNEKYIFGILGRSIENPKFNDGVTFVIFYRFHTKAIYAMVYS